MSTNRILALGALAFLLYLALTHWLRVTFPRTEVGFETAVQGRVTGTLHTQHQRTFYLNGQTSPRYGFASFAPAPPIQSEQPVANSLDEYLRKGDLVRKSGQAPLLTVQRGDTITQWVCPSPEARP